MKRFIESGAVRIGAAIQNVCANLDFEVLSLPGGCLIAVLLWLYATTMDSMSGASRLVRTSGSMIGAGGIASERLAQPISACVGCGC
jgi:hypothetical protein